MGEDYNGAATDAREEEEKKGTGGCEDNEGKGKENKSKQQQKHKKEDGQGRKKVSSSTAVVVLGVDLHCDGCARKVVKAVRAAQGVEGVAVDVAAGTVMVSGQGVVNPWDLKDRVESRTHKHVVFLSPPKPPPP